MRNAFWATWRFLGSIQLTLILSFILCLDLAVGFLFLRSNLSTFVRMNDMGVLPWVQTYGLYNLQATGWFFILLFLLALFALNTFICTTNRVQGILVRSKKRRPRFAVFAPHIMHYAVLVILCGYVSSYMLSESYPGRAMRVGQSMELPNQAGTVTFAGFGQDYYRGTRIDVFDGYVLKPNAKLTFVHGDTHDEHILNFNEPAKFNGYGLYLTDFYPRKEEVRNNRQYIRMTIRRDPSSFVYLFGLALFVFGLGVYVFDRGLRRK